MLAVGEDDPSDRDLVHLADGLADHRECVMADLAVGPQVVGPDEVAGVDLVAVDELVDLNGAGGFQCNVFELLLRDLNEGVFVERVALDDVLVGDFLACVGVHLQVLDAVAGLPVELVERDLLALRGGRVQRDRTRDERKSEEAFPVGARGHYADLLWAGLGFRTIQLVWFRHADRPALDSSVRAAPGETPVC